MISLYLKTIWSIFLAEKKKGAVTKKAFPFDELMEELFNPKKKENIKHIKWLLTFQCDNISLLWLNLIMGLKRLVIIF